MIGTEPVTTRRRTPSASYGHVRFGFESQSRRLVFSRTICVCVTYRESPLGPRFDVGDREEQLVVVCSNTPSELLHTLTNRLGKFSEGSMS